MLIVTGTTWSILKDRWQKFLSGKSIVLSTEPLYWIFFRVGERKLHFFIPLSLFIPQTEYRPRWLEWEEQVGNLLSLFLNFIFRGRGKRRKGKWTNLTSLTQECETSCNALRKFFHQLSLFITQRKVRTNSSRGLQDIRVTRHTVVVFFWKERSWSWWRKRWLTAIHTAASRSEVTRRRGGTGRRFRDRKSQARPEWPRWRSGLGNIRQLAAGHRHHWTTSFKLDFLPLRISLFHRHSFRPCFLCPYYFFFFFIIFFLFDI